MTSKGVVFKTCSCPGSDSRTTRRNRHCPQLSGRGHGSWQFECYVTDLSGRSRQIRRGGFRSAPAARAARDALQAQTPQSLAGSTWRLEKWLRYWLSTRQSIRPGTLRSYTQHCDQILIPLLGEVRLTELNSLHLTDAFARLAARKTRYGQPLAPSTIHRVRATLRAALNAAIRHGLLERNPARHIELPSALRPHPVVWTDDRVQAWLDHGVRGAVMVWTVDQLAAFLDYVEGDRLYALWHLIALRGLRRGEAAGLRWCDVDLAARHLSITQQRVEISGQVLIGPPKSAASRRTVALDRLTVRALRTHRERQRFERQAAGAGWTDTGYVFTRADGQPLVPSYLTHRFGRLVAASGQPPVRLHDLRHGAASLAHNAGVDLKSVQDQFGHSTIVLTADTYTSVLPAAQHAAAAATAALVLAAARRARGEMSRKARRHRRADVRMNSGYVAATAAARRGGRAAAASIRKPANRPLSA